MPARPAPELFQKALEILKLALKEDAAAHDLTSQIFIAPKQKGLAILTAKQPGIWCGDVVLAAAQKLYRSGISIQKKVHDGQPVRAGQVLVRLSGNLRSLLGLERSLLNMLQHLCGISSLTRKYVQKAGKTRILDTRKTTPGWRILERYAVTAGSGLNHRLNLKAAVLIKENHLVSAQTGLPACIQKARRLSKPVIIEAENPNQVAQFLKLNVDRILLDNFSPAQIRQALKLRRKLKSKIAFEVSGGIHLGNLPQYTPSGVEFISVGAITHSAPALDLSLRVLPQ